MIWCRVIAEGEDFVLDTRLGFDRVPVRTDRIVLTGQEVEEPFEEELVGRVLVVERVTFAARGYGQAGGETYIECREEAP